MLDELCNTMKQLPHILIVSGVWPHFIGNNEAANVICHEITDRLVRSGRFQISYCVINSGDTAMPASAGQEVADLSVAGVRFLNPVKLPAEPISGAGFLSKLMSVLSGRPDRLLVGTDHQDLLLNSLGGALPDAILAIWSEQAGYLVSQLACPLFNYAGNPDYKVFEARSELRSRFGKASLKATIRDKFLFHVIKSAHLQTMRRFDLMWNVAANDAEDYRQSGVNARYLQNMWPATLQDDILERREECESPKFLKIIGNVGNLSATGNSFGLLTLVEDIIPQLRKKLGEGTFQVHLCGGGRPFPGIEPLLNDPHVFVRGYVPDIDPEILSSQVFLVANNSRSFKVGHTRFLHAWSLGACVVAFSDSALSMPEIVHNQNALLGDTPEEVADLIVEASRNIELRRRIASGGMATLREWFAPARVVEEMMRDMESHQSLRAKEQKS